MRTEAKPCSLGRSVSAHPNERRSDLLVGNRCPHSLVGLAPRMVFFRLPRHYGPGARGKRGRGFLGLRFQLRKSDGLSAVVHLHGSVLPLADQSLAACGPIAMGAGLQLQLGSFMPDSPVIADSALGL